MLSGEVKPCAIVRSSVLGLVSCAGIEGRDSCYGLFLGTYTTGLNMCNAWGGHLLTSRQQSWGQGGILDQMRLAWSTYTYFLGGYRGTVWVIVGYLYLDRVCF